jgi:hypothetical protein
MNIWFIISVLLFAAVLYLIKKLYDFANIIIVFEDHISEVMDTIEESDKALNSILEMKFFFDSPEIQNIIAVAKETIMFSKVKLNSIAAKFVDLSKKKYVLYVDENSNEDNNVVTNDGDEKITEQERIANSVKVPRFTTPRQVPLRLRERNGNNGDNIE